MGLNARLEWDSSKQIAPKQESLAGPEGDFDPIWDLRALGSVDFNDDTEGKTDETPSRIAVFGGSLPTIALISTPMRLSAQKPKMRGMEIPLGGRIK